MDYFRFYFAYYLVMGGELKIVYASFSREESWEVIFYDSTTRRRLPVKLKLEDPQKLYELGQRGQGLPDFAAKQSLQAGIDRGRGGMFLKLTNEQYSKLLRKRKYEPCKSLTDERIRY